MRSRLAEYAGQTLVFTARFIRYSKTDRGSNVALIRDVRLDGVCVTDHMWIHRTKKMKLLDLQDGDIVTLQAEVEKYWKDQYFAIPQDAQYDYGFKGIQVLNVRRKGQKDNANSNRSDKRNRS